MFDYIVVLVLCFIEPEIVSGIEFNCLDLMLPDKPLLQVTVFAVHRNCLRFFTLSYDKIASNSSD